MPDGLAEDIDKVHCTLCCRLLALLTYCHIIIIVVIIIISSCKQTGSVLCGQSSNWRGGQ